MKPIEEWRRIPSAPDYEASSLGRVRRATGVSGTFAGRVLTPDVGKNGYVRVGVIVAGKPKKLLVHRAVCEAFYGPAPTLTHQAAHGDGVKSNNTLGNLRWATPSENRADIAVYGPGICEENAPHRKLDRAAVAEIRNTPRSYGFATRLAGKFGVSRSCVQAIRDPRRGLWPSVPFLGSPL